MTPCLDRITDIVIAQRWRCQVAPQSTRECIEAALRTWPVMQGAGVAARREDDIAESIRYQIQRDGKRRTRVLLEFMLRVLAAIVAHLLIVVIFASEPELLMEARKELGA